MFYEQSDEHKVDRREEPVARTLERHVQTVLVSIITGGILFTAAFTFNTHADMRLVTARLEDLSTQVTELKADIKNGQSVLNNKLADLEGRVLILETNQSKGK